MPKVTDVEVSVFVIGWSRREEKSLEFPFTILIFALFLCLHAGLTGTGKTKLLHELERSGHQVLDLEGLARHKGSLLGLWHQEIQPTQKMFETCVRRKLASFSTDLPVWMESESSKVC